MKLSPMLCASLVALAAFALSANGAVAQPPPPVAAPAPVPPPAGAPATCTGGANLVQNPGFEASPTAFAPWVEAWTDPFTLVAAGGVAGSARAAALGAVPGINSLTQNINGTVAGQLYTVCFWLKHDTVPLNSSAQNSFEVRWGGRALLTIIGSLGFDWTRYQFAVRATGTDALRFDAQEIPGFWRLDNVGVYHGAPIPWRISNTVSKTP
jgi:hypothetical protein